MFKIFKRFTNAFRYAWKMDLEVNYKNKVITTAAPRCFLDFFLDAFFWPSEYLEDDGQPKTISNEKADVTDGLFRL